MAAYRKLPRKQIRYWLFRFKTASVAGGAAAKGAPRGLRQHFEEHRHFLGWGLFNESRGWDVGESDPLKIVPLQRGSGDLWKDVVDEEARDFPVAAAIDAGSEGVEDGC